MPTGSADGSSDGLADDDEANSTETTGDGARPGLRPVPDYYGQLSDGDLIDEVRDGDTEAYSRLYQRHVKAAYNLARQLARSTAEADDLVSEAFARVLDTLRTGRGPDSAFRAYLLTTLRHTAYDKSKADRRIELSGDVTTMTGVASESVSVPFADPAVAGLERTLAAKAFHRLPERWQAVLWQTEIEEQSPAEVAPLLGLSPNGVSALAYRAREGLRQAYLQVHLADVETATCRATVDRLGAWTRSGLSKRETAHVEHHLDRCASCRELAAELADLNTALRGVLPPLLLGAGAAGYLAAAAGGGTKAAGAVGLPAAVQQPFVGAATAAAAVAAAVTIGFGVQQDPAEPPLRHAQPSTERTHPSPVPTTESPRPAPHRAHPHAASSSTVDTSTPEPPRETSAHQGIPLLGVVRTGDVRLHAGLPKTFDVTVRNSGTAPSEKITAELHLDDGVRALPAEPTESAAVACPGGTGTVRCGTEQRLRPGGSTVLRFRLQADEPVTDGRLDCVVRDGSRVTNYVTRFTVGAIDGVIGGLPGVVTPPQEPTHDPGTAPPDEPGAEQPATGD